MAVETKPTSKEPQFQEKCLKCGQAMIESHCKVFCPSCGFMRDCNDQW